MALLLLPILAFVAHLTSDNAKTEPGPAAPLPSTPAVASAVSDDTVVDLGVTDQLQQEFSETLASLELRALIPTTEAELAAWALREYPADMWLYDLLREQYGYQGTWQHLLRESGEFLRFDYPSKADEPNCRPSVHAIQRMANVAGFALILDPSGNILLPQQLWHNGVPSVQHARIERAPVLSMPNTPPLPTSAPPNYSHHIVADDSLRPSTILYLLVAGCIAGSPLDRMSPKWKAFLLSHQEGQAADGTDCRRTNACTTLFETLLCERQHLVDLMRSQSSSPPRHNGQ